MMKITGLGVSRLKNLSSVFEYVHVSIPGRIYILLDHTYKMSKISPALLFHQDY